MKKKWLPMTLVLAGSLLLAPAVTAMDPVPIFLNGEKSEVDGLIINSTTYVPLRYLSEKMGAVVDYKDRMVYVETTERKTLTKGELDKLPLKKVGEKVLKNDIGYTINSIIYINKNSKPYISMTFVESGTINSEFGLLPAFAYQSRNGEVQIIKNYSITADTKLNANWRRSFTLEFPSPGEIKSIIYFPNSSSQALGRWMP